MGIARNAVIVGAAAAGVGVVCAGIAGAGAVTFAVAACKSRLSRMRGKVVLITGGSRGLGLALAEEFGRKGAKLALAARDGEALERARDLLVSRRCVRDAQDVFLFTGDLRKPEDVDEMIRQTTGYHGQIDVLVNNASILAVGPLENQTVEDFRDAMETNFFSGLYCTLAVLPQMRERRAGHIVNIASIGGKIAVPHMLPYVASKFAMVGFSQGLNAELRAKGIQVTTVCPGLMRTGSHLNAEFKGDAAKEYRWFSMVAGLPGLSTSARMAARRIVFAVASGQHEIVITPQAMLAARFGNLLPEITSRGMQLMNSALPQSPSASKRASKGADIRDLEVKPAVKLAHAAALRYNQTGA